MNFKRLVGKMTHRAFRFLYCLVPLVGLCFMVSALSCSAGEGRSQFETRDVFIQTAGGSRISLSIEIARSDTERSRGLMNRKTLDDGKAMLFVFDRDRILSFWMKNTLIPLSVAFISSEGKILEIRDMEPKSLTTIYSSRSARYALEAPRGWFDRAGISLGDRLSYPDE
ncbi:MAG: DUF192 domain-containing protein [Treponema sp.]|jgi:uncharacterized membrane protein (UPF0127 family)|nr:DUF192 domain-containing protein [Treponema sp.]